MVADPHHIDDAPFGGFDILLADFSGGAFYLYSFLKGER